MTELIATASAEATAARLDTSVALLQAAADPIRWTVLQRLSSSAACVCNLQEQVPIAANLLSYHLKVLRDVGLVTTSRRGRWIDYALAEDALDRCTRRSRARRKAWAAGRSERHRAAADHDPGPVGGPGGGRAGLGGAPTG